MNRIVQGTLRRSMSFRSLQALTYAERLMKNRLITYYTTLHLVATFLPANTAEKTIHQYWEETGISFSEVPVDNSKCYSSYDYFRGCVSALNVLASEQIERSKLIPTSLVGNSKIKQKEKKREFGSLTEVSLAEGMSDEEKKLSIFQKVEKSKAEAEIVEVQMSKIYNSTKDASRNEKVDFEIINRDFVRNIEANEKLAGKRAVIASSAVNAILKEHDAHSYLQPTQYLDEMRQNGDKKFVGVGVEVKKIPEGFVFVRIIEGGPMKKVGLFKKGYLLKKIDDKDISGLEFERVIGMIRGNDGEPIKITVQRGEHEVSGKIIRAKIELKNVSYEKKQSMGKSVGVIKLQNFTDESACQKIAGFLSQSKKDNVSGIILDLRGNGGGIVDQARCIGGLFMGDEVVMGEKSLSTDDGHFQSPEENCSASAGIEKVQESLESNPVRFSRTVSLNGFSRATKVTNLPVVVLIDGLSASASEIVSGAFQDQKRAWIVGERSFGKATVQRIKPGWNCNRKIARARTIQRFYLPSGRTNQLVGVTPDFTVPFKPNATEEDRFSLREADLYPNALAPEGPKWAQKRPTEVAKISKCISENQRALKAFNGHQSQEEDADFQSLMAEEILLCDQIAGKIKQ